VTFVTIGEKRLGAGSTSPVVPTHRAQRRITSAKRSASLASFGMHTDTGESQSFRSPRGCQVTSIEPQSGSDSEA